MKRALPKLVSAAIMGMALLSEQVFAVDPCNPPLASTVASRPKWLCLLALGLFLLSPPSFASNPEGGKSRGPRLLSVHASCGDCQLMVGESLEVDLVATYSDGSVGPPRSFNIRPSILQTVAIAGRKVTALRADDVTLNISVWDGWGGGQADEVSIRLRLRNPGDSDIDNMPDSWELENGLNPNFPEDRYQDPDHDDLVNYRELRAGTNPHLEDTDGDGRDDGREVANDRTNPTLPDADPNTPPGVPQGEGIQALDRRDEAPPTVAIVEPDGALPNRRPYKIAIDAADDRRVSKVELWAKGRLVGVDTKAPFLIPIVPNRDDPPLEIYAVAFDGEAGNRVESARVLLKILPDEPPEIRFLGSKNIKVMEDSSFDVMVAATDDHKIVSVEVLQDGALLGKGSNVLASFELRAPLGRPTTTLEAHAVDDIGQLASTTWVVQVTPDPPPVIAFLSPVADTGGLLEALAGSNLQVRLTASDNRKLQFVELKVAGASAGRLKAPPFEWIVPLPAGPSSLALEAIVFDDLGKSATASLTLMLLIDRCNPLLASSVASRPKWLVIDGRPMTEAEIRAEVAAGYPKPSPKGVLSAWKQPWQS